MVAIDMSLTSLKVIGKEACLRTKGPFGVSKDLGPRRCPNTWKKGKIKGNKGFYESGR